MATLRRALALVAVTVGLAACVPVKLSPECREMISECLKDCPNDPGRDHRWKQTNVGDDSRTQCERHCHEMCSE